MRTQFSHDLMDSDSVPEISLIKDYPVGDVRSSTRAEIIENRDIVLLGERIGDVTPDEAGSSGDKDSHYDAFTALATSAPQISRHLRILVPSPVPVYSLVDARRAWTAK